MNIIPFPVPDPSRPFGSDKCESYSGVCAGHYMTPEEALVATTPAHSKPPSTIVKEFSLSYRGKEVSDAMIDDLARKVLLPTSDVVMWLEPP